MFGSRTTPAPAFFKAACNSPAGIDGREDGRADFRSPDAGGRSARMKYSWTGLVITIAPRNWLAFAARASTVGLGSHTGTALMTPLVAGDHARGYPINGM